ncbi:MAG: UDP-3-O-(3-hydroxymyristoyl)glucosamine N-acyltransferase [Spirochaetota bacterium]
MSLVKRTAAEVASFLSGTVQGDASVVFSGFSGTDAIADGSIVCLEDEKFLPAVLASRALAIVTAKVLASGKTEIIVPDTKEAFFRLLTFFYPDDAVTPGVSPKASVASSAKLPHSACVEDNVVIGEHVVIGERSVIKSGAVIGKGSVIGADTVIHPNVTLYPGMEIGSHVIIHAGAVIGSDGFGYRETPVGREKIPQKGKVIIEDDVEIGANTTIDRSTLGATIIKRGAKIDNLVHIAHNCTVGEHAVIVAQVGVAGSTRIGSGVILAGQVGISDHCDIGDKTVIGAQAGVMSNVKVPANSLLWGSPTQNMKDEKLKLVSLRKLYALTKFIEEKFGMKF